MDADRFDGRTRRLAATPPRLRSFSAAWFLICSLLTIAIGTPATAGGGPENVLLVVNSHSWASLTVANHFAHLRRVPPSHVFCLPWKRDVGTVHSDDFRDKILTPVLREIERRKLGAQIDYVVYSSDFPTRVAFEKDFDERPKQPAGSLTSMTYLAPLVLAKRREYTGLNVNWYMQPMGRGECATRGFRAQYGWNAQGERVEEGGQHYLLSTVLGCTTGMGNSVTEVVAYLRRAAAADGTMPAGTIYYLDNQDVRSRTRQGGFATAVAELEKLGVGAEIVQGKLPQNRRDVQGAMLGSASFDWGKSGSRILPGAICEHLTSFGGDLRAPRGQTVLTELLRHGAAGASGTVIEPFAIGHKFPHPMVHVHYARGCTLAEAFYQSVYGPYQLLVVGDPLCRPWARIPVVSVAGIEPGQEVSGELRVQPVVRMPADGKLDHLELLLDGRLVARGQPDAAFRFDTAKLSDGYHELRVIAVDGSPIETQGRMILPIATNNHGRTIDVQSPPGGTVRFDERIALSVDAPNVKDVVVTAHGRLLAKAAGPTATIEIEARQLGLGPIELSVVGLGGGGLETNVVASPVRLHVQPPPPLRLRDVPSRRRPGLQLRRGNGTTVVVPDMGAAKWITDAGVGANETFEVTGYFQVDRDDVYQFQPYHMLKRLHIRVDGRPVFDAENSDRRLDYVPVALAAGWHRVEIEATTGDTRYLFVTFGGPGTRAPAAPEFQH